MGYAPTMPALPVRRSSTERPMKLKPGPPRRPMTAGGGVVPSWACPVTQRGGSARLRGDVFHHPRHLCEVEAATRADIVARQRLERDLLRTRLRIAPPQRPASHRALRPLTASPARKPPASLSPTPHLAFVPSPPPAATRTPPAASPEMPRTAPRPATSPILAASHGDCSPGYAARTKHRPQTCRAPPSRSAALTDEVSQRSVSVSPVPLVEDDPVPPAVREANKRIRALLRESRMVRASLVAEEARAAGALRNHAVYLVRRAHSSLQEQRATALRALVEDPRMPKQVERVEQWWQDCVAGRCGKRALRLALRALWKQQAEDRATSILHEVARQRRNLQRAVKEDVDCLRQGELDVVINREADRRACIVVEEGGWRDTMQSDMAHWANHLEVARRAEQLEAEEDVERSLTENEEETHLERLEEMFSSDMLLLGDDRRRAAQKLEQFLWARKYGNAGRKARLRELRLALRKVWEETLLDKMKSVAEYVTLSQDELSCAIYEVDRARTRRSPRGKKHTLRMSLTYKNGEEVDESGDPEVVEHMGLLRRINSARRERAQMQQRWEGIAGQRVARLQAEHAAEVTERASEQESAYASFQRPDPPQLVTKTTTIYRKQQPRELERRHVSFFGKENAVEGDRSPVRTGSGSMDSPGRVSPRGSQGRVRRSSSIVDLFLPSYAGDNSGMWAGEGGTVPPVGRGIHRVVASTVQEESRHRNLLVQGYLDGMMDMHFRADDEAFGIIWRWVRRVERGEEGARSSIARSEAAAWAALAKDEREGRAFVHRRAMFRKAQTAAPQPFAA